MGSQNPATGLYPQPVESGQYNQNIFEIHFNITLISMPSFPIYWRRVHRKISGQSQCWYRFCVRQQILVSAVLHMHSTKVSAITRLRYG